MIVSSGYNIAGPEVEAALVAHPAVAECAVVGAPDAARGMIVKAYVVLRAGETAIGRDGARAGRAREGGDRAVQISALDRVPGCAAADRMGKVQRYLLRPGRPKYRQGAGMNWGTMSRAERDAAYNKGRRWPTARR